MFELEYYLVFFEIMQSQAENLRSGLVCRITLTFWVADTTEVIPVIYSRMPTVAWSDVSWKCFILMAQLLCTLSHRHSEKYKGKILQCVYWNIYIIIYTKFTN